MAHAVEALAVGISSIKVCAHTMLILERLGAMSMSGSMRKTGCILQNRRIILQSMRPRHMGG